MNGNARDALLRQAWALPAFEGRVSELSEIAERIGRRPLHAAAPMSVPYTVTNLAAAARRMSRARGGGATALPGRLLLGSSPSALRLLGARLREGCVLVSGTNGKTTTASMIASILRATGREVVHNRAGANAHAGVATALLEHPGEIGVFEVDEAWLPIIAAELAPRVIVLGNLFRDRLDAYGDLDALAAAWGRMSAGDLGARLVLNADDSLVAGLSRRSAAGKANESIFFGVEDRSLALPGVEQTADSVRCPGCDRPLRFEARLLSHLGHYRCDGCEARRPTPAVRAEEVSFDGLAGSSFALAGAGRRLSVRLGLPGLYNVYNALAAAAAALALGVEPLGVATALAAFAPVFGRAERISVGGTSIWILLMKNPAGANELLRTLRRDGSTRFDLLIALNDGVADGRDVSWIWDADFELLADRVGTVVCSGDRAAELALRLKYAGWPVARMAVDPDLASALDRGLAGAPRRLLVLPTYSALLAIHAELERRGLAHPYWAAPPAAELAQ